MSLSSGPSSLSGVSLIRSRTARVLVLPLGRMPRAVYEDILHSIRRLGSVVPMSALVAAAAAPHAREGKDSPFRGCDWKRARLNLEFVDAAVSTREELPEDDGPIALNGAAANSRGGYVVVPSPLSVPCEWDELRVCDKILGVVCVVHAPSADLNLAHRHWQEVRAQLHHPGGPFVYRCYTFDVEASLASVARDSWSYMPPRGGPDSPSPTAADDLLLETLLHELAATLLDNFEASIKKLPPSADLKSPLEAASVAASGQTATQADQQARAKKVRSGRQKKYVADYCLLAGDPLTAIKQYKAAASDCRNANDPIWQASSLEGHASALAALEQEKDVPAFCEQVVELLDESLATLSRAPYASVLGIEASFKLARYLQQWSRKCEAVEVLMRMYELKMDCSAHDQIALAIEAAILCHQVGFERKFGFFLVQAAGLYRELHQSASCHALLRMASPVFRLDGFSRSVLDASLHEDDETAGGSSQEDLDQWQRVVGSGSSTGDPLAYLEHIRRMSAAKQKERGFRVGRWVFIQKSLLEHLIFSAKQMQDDVLTASCTAYLLRTLYPWLEPSYQSSIAQDLWTATKLLPLNINTIDLTGLPVVHSLRPLDLEADLAPWVDPLDEIAPTSEDEDEPEAMGMGTCSRTRRAQAAAQGDVFLSRPDDHQGGGGHSHSQRKLPPRKLRFVCQESVDVEVFVSNPLKVPMLIQHMSLLTSGVPFDAFTVSFSLPPETYHQRVLLSGVPRAQGDLNLRGVAIRTFNAVWEHRVDENGKGIRPSYDDPDSSPYCPSPPLSSTPLSPVLVHPIEIVPALPLVTLSYTVCGNTASSLLLGERRRAQLRVHNTGLTSIADVELFIEHQFTAMSAQSQATYYGSKEEMEEIERNTRAKLATEHHDAPSFGRRLSSSSSVPPTTMRTPSSSLASSRPLVTFDPESLKAQLPLRPGGVLTLHIDITAHTECCGARFILSYAADTSSRLFRCIQYPVSWKVEHGLRLNSLHVYHFLPQTSSASAATPAMTTRTLAPSMPEWSLPPSALSRLPLGGQSPSSPGSQLSSELNLMTASDCMLILELTNTSTAHFRLTCTLDGAPYKTHSMLIDKSSSQRLILSLPRLSFGSLADDQHLRRIAHDLLANESTGTIASSSAAASWRTDRVFLSLLRRFHERVKLVWTSSDESRGSVAGFGHPDRDGLGPQVETTPVHLYRLLPDPLEFASSLVLIDPVSTSSPTNLCSPVFNSPRACSFPFPTVTVAASPAAPSASPSSSSLGPRRTRALVGSFHRLSVSLVNHSSCDLGPLELSIVPFQEAVGGQVDTRLQDKMLVAGTLTRRFTECKSGPEHRLEHEVLVCFTSAGRFSFQFVARQKEAVHEQAQLLSPPTTLVDESDPFALLTALAASTTHDPPTSTLRRRSTVATDDAAAATASASHLLGEHESRALDAARYELDVTDSESDEPEASPAITRRASPAPAAPHAPELVFRCPHVLLVQAGLS